MALSSAPNATILPSNPTGFRPVGREAQHISARKTTGPLFFAIAFTASCTPKCATKITAAGRYSGLTPGPSGERDARSPRRPGAEEKSAITLASYFKQRTTQGLLRRGVSMLAGVGDTAWRARRS